MIAPIPTRGGFPRASYTLGGTPMFSDETNDLVGKAMDSRQQLHDGMTSLQQAQQTQEMAAAETRRQTDTVGQLRTAALSARQAALDAITRELAFEGEQQQQRGGGQQP